MVQLALILVIIITMDYGIMIKRVKPQLSPTEHNSTPKKLHTRLFFCPIYIPKKTKKPSFAGYSYQGITFIMSWTVFQALPKLLLFESVIACSTWVEKAMQTLQCNKKSFRFVREWLDSLG